MTLGPRGSRLLSPGSGRRQPPNRRVTAAKALTGRTQGSVSVGNHTGTYSPTCRRTRPAVDCGDLNRAPRGRGLCSFPLRRAPSWVQRACQACLLPLAPADAGPTCPSGVRALHCDRNGNPWPQYEICHVANTGSGFTLSHFTKGLNTRPSSSTRCLKFRKL